MDKQKFTENRAGNLVEISVPKKDWAFVPDTIPPNWEFPPNLWPILAEAKQELARLDGIARSLPNPELLLQPLQSREALRSSSLEGTYATPQELLLFELQPREPTSAKDPINAHLEVANYSKSLRRGLQLLDELPFCLRLIRELHKVLLSNVRGKDKAPGEFRTTQNHIGSNYRFIPPPPKFLDDCLNNLELELNNQEPKYDHLIHCYVLHYQFETIHPFLDGNGRVGRALLSLMIYKLCNLSMPWLYMSAFFERYRDEYINNLFQVSANSDWDTWIEFCLRGTIEQAKDSIQRCDKLKLLRDQIHQMLDAAGPRAHPIVEGLFTIPVISVADTARNYKVSYPTAKSDIAKLEKLGILTHVSDTYPKLYYCEPIFSIAYEESGE